MKERQQRRRHGEKLLDFSRLLFAATESDYIYAAAAANDNEPFTRRLR